MQTYGTTPGDREVPDLIGIYSPVMGSGKSEVAKVLIEEHGYKLVKFAGCLKAMTRTFLEQLGYGSLIIERMVEGDLKEEPIAALPVREGAVTTRRLLQTIGTEWGRDQIYSHLWVDVTVARIEHLRNKGHKVVVDDMRFLNEIEAIRSLGGRTLKLTRPSASSTTTSHPSEGALDGLDVFDYWLLNKGSLEDLKNMTRSIVK